MWNCNLLLLLFFLEYVNNLLFRRTKDIFFLKKRLSNISNKNFFSFEVSNNTFAFFKVQFGIYLINKIILLKSIHCYILYPVVGSSVLHFEKWNAASSAIQKICSLCELLSTLHCKRKNAFLQITLLASFVEIVFCETVCEYQRQFAAWIVNTF